MVQFKVSLKSQFPQCSGYDVHLIQGESKKSSLWGIGVAQFKCLALDSGSGPDLMVYGIEAHIRLCADGTDRAWDSLSVSRTLPFAFSLSLSLSLSK